MQIHDVVQGSPEWDTLRAKHNTASEAPAMMGASKKVKRNELLHMKATGSEREVSDWVKANLFDKGHEIEAMARPIAEEIIGEDLFPATATDVVDGIGLLASFDGITMAEDTTWECKQWNEDKAACVRAGQVPEEDRWQVVQQLTVSRASRCLYMVTDGTREKTVHCWATLSPADEKTLIAGWKQFAEDLKNYQPVEVIQAAVAAPIRDLPAITYRLDGLTLHSNFAEYRVAAEKLVEDSKKPLETDQDFADRESLNKKFAEAEDRLGVVRSQVIGEVKDVDKFCRDLDEIRELLRQARLNGEKSVQKRKDEIRLSIQQKATAAFAEHIATLNKRIGHNYMPTVQRNFAGVMKNKRTLASLQDAVDTELARAKIEASAAADKIEINLKALPELSEGFALFPDLATLVLKPADDFAAAVKLRVSDHKQKLEAERERIRQEEQARIAREQSEEAERVAQRQAAVAQAIDPEGTPDTGATIKLGDICTRLGFTVTADFLAAQGFKPHTTDKSAKLYLESNFPLICAALIRHIQSVANIPMKLAA